jgi:cell wall-associated NlpC family hydrolase
VSVRERIVSVARWGVRNEARIHYAEVRPIPLRRALPLTTDCSGFVTLCYFLGGGEDPNGLDYIGEGYTGTLLRHMRHVPRSDVRRADLVVWGRYPGHHVAVVLEPGDDPLLCSHGHERGPLEIRFSQQDRAQAGPATWLTSP